MNDVMPWTSSCDDVRNEEVVWQQYEQMQKETRRNMNDEQKWAFPAETQVKNYVDVDRGSTEFACLKMLFKKKNIRYVVVCMQQSYLEVLETNSSKTRLQQFCQSNCLIQLRQTFAIYRFRSEKCDSKWRHRAFPSQEFNFQDWRARCVIVSCDADVTSDYVTIWGFLRWQHWNLGPLIIFRDEYLLAETLWTRDVLLFFNDSFLSKISR